jgi:hypothetical protein
LDKKIYFLKKRFCGYTVTGACNLLLVKGNKAILYFLQVGTCNLDFGNIVDIVDEINSCTQFNKIEAEHIVKELKELGVSAELA